MTLHINKIYSFINNNSAYKSNSSTEKLLTKITSDILNNMDKQKLTLLVLLDLSSAFDTVQQQTLSKILKHKFNIQVNRLNWINLYLTHRTIKININNSDNFSLKHGVPQENCVDPMLFFSLHKLYV